MKRDPCESFRIIVLSGTARVGHDVFLIPGPSYLSQSTERSVRATRHFEQTQINVQFFPRINNLLTKSTLSYNLHTKQILSYEYL